MTIYLVAPTSGSTDYNPVRDIIINRALRMVGAYASTDVPRPEQTSDALDVLNMMLKTWQVDEHLWVKKFATLTLVEGQASYQLGAGSTDTCTYNDTGTAIDRPTRIFSASRKSSDGYEIPINSIGRGDYHRLTNKTVQGKPVQYYYDPQLVLGTLYIWPTPDDDTDTMVLNIDRPLQDIIADTETYDLPQEWFDCICYGLAIRLAPEYGIPIAERQVLAAEYSAIKESVMSYDRENTSVFFAQSRY